MADPWDTPPIPKQGDEDFEKTYAGVGWIMTTWSAIETDLARLYSLFVGQHDDIPALLAYGDPTIFRTRFQNLAREAEKFFVRHPHQAAETVFDWLAKQLIGFADRRNDVAHGMVFRMETLLYFRERMDPSVIHRANYAVMPPFHTFRRHSLKGGPGYAYTSIELAALKNQLFQLMAPLHLLRNEFLPSDQREELPGVFVALGATLRLPPPTP